MMCINESGDMDYSNEVQYNAVNMHAKRNRGSTVKVNPYAEVAMCTAWCKWCQKPIYNQQDVSYKRFINLYKIYLSLFIIHTT